MKKIIVLLVIFISISGCSKTKVKDSLSIIVKDTTIEVYSKIYLYDLIDTTNGNIISKNIPINTTKTGMYSYPIKIALDNTIYNKDIKIKIVDTTPPLLLANDTYTIVLGYEGEISDLFMFGDNYDRNPTCSIEGHYDFNTIGSYPINYVVRDDSGNSSTQTIVLEVRNDTNTTPISNPVSFTDVINDYKTTNTEIGIDVSKWQEDIDFRKVKDAGASFVMIRMAFQKEKNGKISIDPYYMDNINKAKAVGLKVGIYLYSTATNIKEAKEQARWILKTLDGKHLDLPIVFDWESWSEFSKFNINLFDINTIAKAFITTIEDTKYIGMLYSSKTYLNHIWQVELFDSIWLAHYTKQTDYDGHYQIWQLTNQGRIAGIEGDVDINILYK